MNEFDRLYRSIIKEGKADPGDKKGAKLSWNKHRDKWETRQSSKKSRRQGKEDIKKEIKESRDVAGATETETGGFNTFDILAEQLLEEAGRCTGPTKKASSTAKGKKWMQCVKNPSGKGYKRVHWGQKGVKVTGKSGNTKRKKSFRARHKCSSAKPGTAKYQACKDW